MNKKQFKTARDLAAETGLSYNAICKLARQGFIEGSIKKGKRHFFLDDYKITRAIKPRPKLNPVESLIEETKLEELKLEADARMKYLSHKKIMIDEIKEAEEKYETEKKTAEHVMWAIEELFAEVKEAVVRMIVRITK